VRCKRWHPYCKSEDITRFTKVGYGNCKTFDHIRMDHIAGRIAPDLCVLPLTQDKHFHGAPVRVHNPMFPHAGGLGDRELIVAVICSLLPVSPLNPA